MIKKSTEAGQPNRVFVWATGQDDNIGDSLLRRAYLGRLREIGDLTVWIGSGSASFISGLGLTKADRIVSSYLRWYREALAAGARGRTVVAVNAGEVPVSRRGAARMMSIVLLVLFVRVRGGAGVWVGAGVPIPRERTALAHCYWLMRRVCSYAGFRDRESLDVVGSAEVVPDWAFELGSSVHDWQPIEFRSTLAVVLRGDRPYPSSDWINWLRDFATRLALTVVVVVQVSRDLETADRLANDLSGTVVEFTADDHKTQEKCLRKVYADSAVAVGDRLHGLIVAATEGAVPLGWVSSSGGKISRHFDAIGLSWVGQHEGSEHCLRVELDIDDIRTLRAQLDESICATRIRLDQIANELTLGAGANT
ncbi:hypothetical protein HCA61_05330 [Rhodococcus sp. HNM0563]|uniref:polysaccharide pyruvyl transferase family protein n=1 Tax=Rhodococcus sp. HNM0563 TaxID=2716339 RepID=UPI00146DC5CD|nr:hypothetical protein [Rhodococcus sp. HNM0563]